jgi:hypothetical protein
VGSTVENPSLLASLDQPGLEKRRALIEQVAASEHFSRSNRLRDFLLYVGRQSLKEGCPEIHEQEIGAKVFGRPQSYDRTSDNIVRVNATELRKRIDSYFALEGAKEPLIFEIPRGGYKLVFRSRVTEVADGPSPGVPDSSHAVSSESAAPASVSTRPGAIAHIAWAVVCLTLAVTCVVLEQQNRKIQAALHPWEGHPAISAFWSGFLDAHRQTDIVLPDDSASVIEDITRRPITLGDYLTRDFIRQIESSDVSADRKASVEQVFNHNLVTFGAVLSAQTVLGEIPATYPRYLTLARNFTADEVKRDNVVFIGGQKSVPWDHLFDDQLNFITDYDYDRGVQLVRNRNPKASEDAIYAVPGAPNNLVGYATIAFLPNPSRTGAAIILAGTDSDATDAAADFLTSEEQMERFLGALHLARFPYFEVLLKTSRLSGTSFNAELIAYRTYPELH